MPTKASIVRRVWLGSCRLKGVAGADLRGFQPGDGCGPCPDRFLLGGGGGGVVAVGVWCWDREAQRELSGELPPEHPADTHRKRSPAEADPERSQTAVAAIAGHWRVV